MVLSDRLTEQTFFTRENIAAQYNQTGVWNWHVPLFWMPQVPEMLTIGKEKEFWTFFMKAECYNPQCLEQAALDEWVRYAKSPGGLRGILETYQSHWTNVDVEAMIMKNGKLACEVMSVGAPEFFGPIVKEQMQKVSDNIVVSEIFEQCGHSLALEKPEKLANLLKKFVSS